MGAAFLAEVEQLAVQLAGDLAGTVGGPPGGEVTVRTLGAADRPGRTVPALLLVLLGSEHGVGVAAAVLVAPDDVTAAGSRGHGQPFPWSSRARHSGSVFSGIRTGGTQVPGLLGVTGR